MSNKVQTLGHSLSFDKFAPMIQSALYERRLSSKHTGRQPLYLGSVALYLILAFGLSACGNQREKKAERTVAVTIEPQKFFIESLSDSSVKVFSLIPAGSNPEEYDPSPSIMRQLAEADAYLYIGQLGFEQRNIPTIREHNPALPLFEMSRKLDSISHLHDPSTDCSHHNEMHDPHYWSSIIGARALAVASYETLSDLYPEESDKWEQRLERLNHRIDSLQMVVAALLGGEKADRSFVIYHPSLSFFAEEFGLRQIVIEEDGKEPSATHLGKVIDEARSYGTKVVFIQPEFESRLAEEVAREIGASIVRINPLQKSWEEEILHIARTLAHE